MSSRGKLDQNNACEAQGRPGPTTTCFLGFEPPFKKMLFPVQRPGEDITAEWEFFGFILLFLFYLSKISIFTYQKIKERKKEKMLSPDWPQFRPPSGQETHFFLRVALPALFLVLFGPHSSFIIARSM